MTLAVDSYFWQSYTPAPPFATPLLTSNTGLIWPELSGFLYNAVGGKSSEWGVSPWHYYSTSAIPKLLLNPLLLLLVPYAIYTSPRVARELYLFPVLGFVAAYSILPHKEWRFIIYVLPLLILAGAVGSTWVWDHRRKGILYGLAATAICASLLLAGTASVGMSAISSWNYPCGEALNRLHTLLAESDISTPGTQQQVVVHLDTFACMAGAMRFLQDAPYHQKTSRALSGPTKQNNKTPCSPGPSGATSTGS
jgi:alpha-1,6-mannosyltransferase